MTSFKVGIITAEGKEYEFNQDLCKNLCCEEFPEAIKKAEQYFAENGIKDYSLRYIMAADGDYKGKCYEGEEVCSLFITKEQIKEALENGIIEIIDRDEEIVACVKDSGIDYFYFDSDNTEDYDSAKDYVQEVGYEYIADCIYVLFEDFVCDNSVEYLCYKYALDEKLQALEQAHEHDNLSNRS